MTPEQFERLLAILESLARGLEGSPRRDLQLLLLGGLVGIIGAILGGIAEALAAYWVSGLRADRRKRVVAEEEATRAREESTHKALEWAGTGRKESFRRADLRGADLRGVDLGPGEGQVDGADLGFADLGKAQLLQANLKRADLIGANLQEANLQEANLTRAKLYGANLSSAKLQGAALHHVTYNNATRWPTGFTPPPEALNMEVRGAPREAKGYSLWLMPSGAVYNALASLISELSEEFFTPNFEPHVTLIGSLDGSEEDILSKTSQLAKVIHPFDIRLTRLHYLDPHFTCLFIKIKKTNDIMGANLKAREVFSRLQDRQYMPHLSLMYGSIPTALKGKIIAEIGKEFDMSFEVRSIHLFSTSGEPKDWFRVEEFTLGGA